MRPHLLALPLLLLLACSSEPATQGPVLIIDEDDAAPDLATSPQDMPDLAQDLATPVEDIPADLAEDLPPDMPPPALPDGPMPVLPSCAERGLTAQPFDAAASGAAMDTVAGDLTVQTSRGPWTLSAQWTGCDAIVFINHHTSAESTWSTLNASLFQQSSPDTIYIFSSYGPDATATQNKLIEQRTRIDAALATLPIAQQDHWRSRIHYNITPLTQTTGSLAQLITTSRLVQLALGIDTRQRWDIAGSLMNIGRTGFIPDLNVAAYLSRYYVFRDALARRIDAEQGVTVVPLMDQLRVTENNKLYEATFPDAATMAGFDTMELDITSTCGPTPTDCGEWDYEAFLQRCRDEACAESDEIALWITQYSRPGTSRWVVDATPFLPLVRAGGLQRVRFGMLWNMNPNTMQVSFRLSKRDAGPTPLQTIPLFQGGDFNADYNARYQPITFTPPPGTTRVELVTLLTGHGQEQANNCAEWCDHTHTFTLNADTNPKAFKRSFPNQAGKTMGCAALVDQGVVPGQYGNWTPQRAAWCPGLAVQPDRQDITAAVLLDQPNTIAYRGTYRNAEPAGGRIRLSSYLVFY